MQVNHEIKKNKIMVTISRLNWNSRNKNIKNKLILGGEKKQTTTRPHLLFTGRNVHISRAKVCHSV